MKDVFNLINKNILRFFYETELFAKRTKQQAITLPVITISREKGSGGSVIARKLVKMLGPPWKLYHKDLIERIAKSAKLEKELIKEIDEKRVSLAEQLVNEFFGRRLPSLTTYQKHLVKVISRIAQRGFAVIIGRGANFILPESLKIRVICEMKQRIKWMMQFENLTEKQAIKIIQKSDKERYEFVKNLYKHTITKAHHYDLVIRTDDKLSVDDATKIIFHLAKLRFQL